MTSTVIDQAVPTGDRVLSEEQADLVTYCLQEVVKDGTGASAGFGKPAAGKTGTTQDNKDAWFVGYTPKLTAAVWVGYADPLPDGSVPTMDEDSPVSRSRGLHGVTGGTLPAAIWRKFMVAASEGVDTGSFAEPTDFPGKVLHEELEQTTTTAPTSSTSSTEHHVDVEHDRRRAPPPTSTTTRRPALLPRPPRPHRRSTDPRRTLARPTVVSRSAGGGSWSGRGSTSARRCRAPRPSPPGPTPRA